MAPGYRREEVTTTVVRLIADDRQLDGTSDIYTLLAWARHELNRHLGNADLDQDPGYRRIWLEPTDEGVAVCFEKTRREEIKEA